jgi:hypothetical protein
MTVSSRQAITFSFSFSFLDSEPTHEKIYATENKYEKIIQSLKYGKGS